MSRQYGRRPEKGVRRAVVSVLVASVVSAGVPGFAAEAPSPTTSRVSINTMRVSINTIAPAISLADEASRQVRAAFERSISIEARRQAQATQGSSPVEGSGHWCAGGMALLAGGVAAAVISGVRRDYNAQKPSPPVGVVLGTSAAVVGGIAMIKSCRR